MVKMLLTIKIWPAGKVYWCRLGTILVAPRQLVKQNKIKIGLKLDDYYQHGLRDIAFLPDTSQENWKLLRDIILWTRASRTWHRKNAFSDDDRRKSLKNSCTPGKRLSNPTTIEHGVTNRRFNKSNLVNGIPLALSFSQFSCKN